MTRRDVRRTLAGAIEAARQQNADQVRLDRATAELLLIQLEGTRTLTSADVRDIEKAVEEAWDELSGAELNAMDKISTGYAATRRRLTAIRTTLNLLGER